MGGKKQTERPHYFPGGSKKEDRRPVDVGKEGGGVVKKPPEVHDQKLLCLPSKKGRGPQFSPLAVRKEENHHF